MAHRYQTYSEIPIEKIQYLQNVAGISNIFQLSLTEINNFFHDMDTWYDNLDKELKYG